MDHALGRNRLGDDPSASDDPPGCGPQPDRLRLVGAIEHDSAWKWLHLRAPDGNLYALGERRRASTADPGL